MKIRACTAVLRSAYFDALSPEERHEELTAANALIGEVPRLSLEEGAVFSEEQSEAVTHLARTVNERWQFSVPTTFRLRGSGEGKAPTAQAWG